LEWPKAPAWSFNDGVVRIYGDYMGNWPPPILRKPLLINDLRYGTRGIQNPLSERT